MSSGGGGRGANETEILKKNLSDQVHRLMDQLKDLDDSREELGEEEYNEERRDTLDQLKELEESLIKMTKGNLGLLDEISSMQLAIQAAISSAFKTPEIMSLFAKRQPEQLRQRLYQVERDYKISHLPKEKYMEEKGEILAALLKLKVDLSDEEKHFLATVSSSQLKDFIQTKDSSASLTDSQKVLNMLASSNS